MKSTELVVPRLIRVQKSSNNWQYTIPSVYGGSYRDTVPTRLVRHRENLVKRGKTFFFKVSMIETLLKMTLGDIQRRYPDWLNLVSQLNVNKPVVADEAAIKEWLKNETRLQKWLQVQAERTASHKKAQKDKKLNAALRILQPHLNHATMNDLKAHLGIE
jgi:hypothetical protein